MKPREECAPCILRWVYERAGVRLSDGEIFPLIRSVSGVLSREFNPTANVGLVCNRAVDSICGFISDAATYYEGLKQQCNKTVNGLLSGTRDYIESGKVPRKKFKRACYVAAASNVAPISAPSRAYNFQEVTDVMRGKDPLPTIRGDIYNAVENATSIFYLADNTGEIGFDSLLIARLKEMGLKVTVVVKEDPFFEDATMKDALFFALDKSADEILTVHGFFVPSECTPPLADAFSQSDLIISKGTGSYEALRGEVEGKPTIYMLKAKCRPIAVDTGVVQGSFVINLER